MAEKYDMGTPIGAERKSRRLHSPLQEMDDVVPQKIDFEVEEPVTPTEAHREPAQPLTLAAIANLLDKTLDQKLGPIAHKMNEMNVR